MAFAKGDFSMQFVCARAGESRSEDWRHSDTTKLVAVLAALGFAIQVQKCWRDKAGDLRVSYQHTPLTQDPLRSGLLPAKKLARMYRNGEMAKADPLHPLLDGHRVIANVLAIEHWQANDQPHHLACCVPARALLIPAPQPTAASGDTIRIRSLHRAAALVLLGYPLLAITEPTAGKPAYTIGNACLLTMPVGMVAVTAAELVLDHKAGTLSPLHPFAFAVDAAKSFHKLLQVVADEMTLLLYKAKASSRYASIYHGASQKAQERANAFLTDD